MDEHIGLGAMKSESVRPDHECESELKSITVIAMPTLSCNLACSYCYANATAPEGGRGGCMSFKTLENMITKFLARFDQVHFVWHGGEPLLLPPAFYRYAVAVQQRFPDKKVTNGFQTNGTLLTEQFLDLCNEFNFSLGFSLDGPQEIHDRTRSFADGHGSFDQVIDSISRARARGFGGGAVVVVSRSNIDQLDRVYDFALEEGLNLKLNPLIDFGRATTNCELGVTAVEYGNALARIYMRWFYDESRISIEPFDEIVNSLLGGRPRTCTFTHSCQNAFISVGPDGTIYPCGRFSRLPQYGMGNVNTDDLDKVLSSELRTRLRQRSENNRACQECEYSSICNAGCPHGAIMRSGNVTDRDYFCVAYKRLFRLADTMISGELRRAKLT